MNRRNSRVRNKGLGLMEKKREWTKTNGKRSVERGSPWAERGPRPNGPARWATEAAAGGRRRTFAALQKRRPPPNTKRRRAAGQQTERRHEKEREKQKQKRTKNKKDGEEKTKNGCGGVPSAIERVSPSAPRTTAGLATLSVVTLPLFMPVPDWCWMMVALAAESSTRPVYLAWKKKKRKLKKLT